MYNNNVNNERIIFNIGKCCLNILLLLRLKAKLYVAGAERNDFKTIINKL